MKARTLVLAAFMSLSPALSAQAKGAAPALPRTGFLDETITVAGNEHRYVVYVPADYTKERRWPLIVFLNGAGECGTDGKKQISVGLAPAIRNDPAAWPFVVVFPQKPDRSSQWEDHDAMVMAMLARAEKDYSIDEKRRFLTGLSQGGHGTWVLGARHADVWAAIAPVCGYGDPREIAPALKTMPVWAFHGEDDKAVPVKQSKDLCAAVEKAGGRADLTLYPGVGHNSWDKAYGKDEPLAEWLLAAAVDRVRAAYVSRPELATIATLVIRDEWHWLHAHDLPAGRGATTWSLTLAPTGLTWRIVAETRETERRTPDPAPRSGTIGGDEGKQFLLRRLRELQARGVFRLPPDMKPFNKEQYQRHGWTIEVTLDGQPGPWRFRCDLSPATGNPELAHQFEALAACCQAIDALK